MLYLSALDFRTEAEYLKEAYNLSIDERMKRERRIKKENGGVPILLLITCTRIEAYSESRPVSHESLERAFSLNHIKCMTRRYALEGTDALRHLFSLSIGIESPLFGEELILSQIKEAVQRAQETHGASSYLLRLGQKVVTFSKAMHSQYRIRIFDSSIPSKMAELIGSGKNVLIIGSGELGRMVADALIKAGNNVTMTLRDSEKMFLLSVGASSVSYDKRHEALKVNDVIISCSSGIYHTLDELDVPYIGGKTLYDLAEPYDIPSYMHPFRLEDLGIRMEEREALLRRLDEEIDRGIAEFEADISMKNEVMAAEDFSISVLRRLSCELDRLPLSQEKRKGFEKALSESLRKAYIENERRKTRTR